MHKPNTNTLIREELSWYFNGSPADCGFKSNFGAFLYFMERGSAPSGGEAFDPESDIDDQLLRATSKHRHIRKRLSLCGEHRNGIYHTLETYFTYRQHHLQIKHVFDDVTSLVVKWHGEDKLLKMIKSDYAGCKKIKQQAKKEIEQCLKIYQMIQETK